MNNSDGVAAGQAQIHLVKRGNTLFVGGPDRSAIPEYLHKSLHRQLTYKHRTFNHGAARREAGGRAVTVTERKLYGIDKRGQLYTNWGWYDRITTHLLHLGVTPVLFDADSVSPHPSGMTQNEVYTADVTNVTRNFTFKPRQDDCLQAVLDHPCGGIIAPTGFGKMVIIVMIALVYPKARIHVITQRIRLVRKIVEYLSRYIPDVGQVGDGVYKEGRRVTVFSAKSLHKSKYDADILLADECITGDAEISTPDGPVLLKNVQVGNVVMCYDGTASVPRRVTRVWARGPKPVMRITTATGKSIRCTKNHLFMTSQGWVAAGDLTLQHLLLVEDKSPGLDRSGKSAGSTGSRSCLCANADAVSVSSFNEVKHSTSSSAAKAPASTESTYSDTHSEQKSTGSSCQCQYDKPCSEHCSATRPSDTQTSKVSSHGSQPTTARSRKPGFATRRSSCDQSECASQSVRTTVTATLQPITTADVCPPLSRSTSSLGQAADQSESPSNGLISSVESDLLGGSATTEVSAGMQQCRCTQKGTTKTQLTSWKPGFRPTSDQLLRYAEEPKAGASGCVEAAGTPSENSSTHTCHSACPTSYESLTRIEELLLEEDVFDIEVEEHHNFFANRLLVHNCHEVVSTESAKAIARYQRSRNFYLTATPQGRGDGADVRLEGLFGPPIFEMYYPEAQALGLVVPICVNWHVTDHIGDPADGVADDTERRRRGLWYNNQRNDIVAGVMRRLPDSEQKLILVDTIHHAVELHRRLRGCNFSLAYDSIELQREARLKSKGLLPEDQPKMTPAYKEHLRLKFESGDGNFIATGTWAVGIDPTHLQHVCLASAASGEIYATQAPGRVSRTNSDGKSVGHVHDFTDGFNDTLSNGPKKRHWVYERLGWSQVVIEHS